MDNVIKKHLRYLKFINRRPRSIDSRRRALVRYSAYLDRVNVDWSEAEKETIEDFLIGKELAPSTVAHEIGHIRGFYGWAVETGHIDVNPAASIQRPRVPIGIPRPMSDIDKEKALKWAPERIRPWLYLAAYAGLRACEIAQLKGEDLIWDQKPELILEREQKGGDSGVVPMHPILIPILKRLPNRGSLFPKLSYQREILPGTQVSASQVQKLTNAYLHSIGIESTLHQLRHWFATKCYQSSGRDLRLTQELLRHKSPVSTAIYTYIDPKDTADVVSGLPYDGGTAA